MQATRIAARQRLGRNSVVRPSTMSRLNQAVEPK